MEDDWKTVELFLPCTLSAHEVPRPRLLNDPRKRQRGR